MLNTENIKNLKGIFQEKDLKSKKLKDFIEEYKSIKKEIPNFNLESDSKSHILSSIHGINEEFSDESNYFE